MKYEVEVLCRGQSQMVGKYERGYQALAHCGRLSRDLVEAAMMRIWLYEGERRQRVVLVWRLPGGGERDGRDERSRRSVAPTRP